MLSSTFTQLKIAMGKILSGVEVHAGLEQFARWAVCSVRLRLRVASAVRILVLMLLDNLTHSAVFFFVSLGKRM